MLENVRYVNTLGAELVFGENGIYVNENDLRDWEWSFSTEYGKIRNFKRRASTKTLPVQIWAESEEKGTEIKNKLHDLALVDIGAGKPGRLYVGDCYLLCYITGSKKSNYLASKRIMSLSLTISTSEEVWYQEHVLWFGKKQDTQLATVGNALVGFAEVGAEEKETESVVPYDYGYPRGYESSSNARITQMVNESIVPCSFRLEIPGHADNPEVVIGDQLHKVHYSIQAGQALVVDSRDRVVKAVTANGSEFNLFRYRDKSSDIFAAIPIGASDITWNGDFIFSLTLYKERSEPLWT